MTEPTNEDRRAWAYRALQAFNQAKGEEMNNADVPDDMADLITDILHMTAEYGIEPDDLIRRARGNYEAECEATTDG